VRVLIILALGQFVVLATGPVAALLMMTGYEKFHRNTTALSAALNVVLNFTLIPRYGGEGAAFATAVSLSVKNVLAVLHVRKRLNIPLFFAGSSH
ncbi:MAG TPA: polysaccharide biosynthesis C-terminal domain-containing protein, partial [Deltaproteobacteria bacterium]|nr:polysaccharide biosynthesis C-terminal domain-containing protein [Deltaproteobacteria bacterium]